MSDRDTLPGTGGDWEQRLRTGLRDLEAGTPGGGGLPGADQVRRTHVRRRTALAVAAALATVAVAGGTVLALDRSATSAPSIPATTGPAPTATAAPEPTTSAPSPTGTGETSAPPAVTVPTTIPDGFLLPHEGEPAPENSDLTAWEPLPDPVELTACTDGATTVGATFPEPTDRRWIAQTGPEYSQVVALEVFGSADDAVAMLSGLTAVAEECLRTQQGGTVVTVAQDLPGSWGQGVLWVQNYRADGTDELGIGGTYTAVVRVGSAIAVTQGYGESAPAIDGPDESIVADLREPLDELAPRMCVFTEAGC